MIKSYTVNFVIVTVYQEVNIVEVVIDVLINLIIIVCGLIIVWEKEIIFLLWLVLSPPFLFLLLSSFISLLVVFRPIIKIKSNLGK